MGLISQILVPYKLDKYQLPNKVLRPNENITINIKKDLYSIGDYISNFNLSEYETVYLTKNGIVIDKIYVPRMFKIESYVRYNNSNIYFFKSNN